MKQIVVIGAGSWGLALTLQAARTGAPVHLRARNPASRLPNGAMPRLPAHPLPAQVTVSNDMPKNAGPENSGSENTGMVLVAVPMQYLRSTLTQLETTAPVVLCCKGIEPHTLRFPLDILHDTRPDLTGAVLSGPNFAHEIAASLPAAAVIASKEPALARTLADRLGTLTFRLYDSTDTAGVQLGGAAKNVIAIAAGATIGAGLGENARAALVTRGLTEIGRLAAATGGLPATIAGLAGMGDLLLTCTGEASRNFRTGAALGSGLTLNETLATLGGVAEGVPTAGALAELAHRKNVSVPVIDSVASLVAGELTVKDAIARLLARPAGTEA